VGERFAELLTMAALEGTSQSFDATLFHRLLDQLTPSAASILSLFLDDRPWPVIQINAESRFGTTEVGIVSLLTRRAGIGQAHAAHSPHLTLLLRLGLAELGPAIGNDRAYEALESDLAMRAAVKEARAVAAGTTLRRCSAQLTPLGRAFLTEVATT